MPTRIDFARRREFRICVPRTHGETSKDGDRFIQPAGYACIFPVNRSTNLPLRTFGRYGVAILLKFSDQI